MARLTWAGVEVKNRDSSCNEMEKDPEFKMPNSLSSVLGLFKITYASLCQVTLYLHQSFPLRKSIFISGRDDLETCNIADTWYGYVVFKYSATLANLRHFRAVLTSGDPSGDQSSPLAASLVSVW